jgi:hypothetical protein
MSAGTSFPAVWFLSAVTPLTRRLLVYFASGAYISGGIPLLALCRELGGLQEREHDDRRQ